MMPYTFIVYVAFFVFLFITIILTNIFFTPAATYAFMSLTMVEESKVILFRMGMAEAFLSGLVAGKMGEGAVSGGLKHSVIMLTIGYLIFVKFVGVF